MSYSRRSRREFDRRLTAKNKRIQRKKETVTKELSGKLGHDPFEEVDERKKYLFIHFRKSGLKMAPTRTWKFMGCMVRTTVDNLILAGFGYVLKIKDWTVRSNEKPEDAWGNYVVRLSKYIHIDREIK